jgi:hypothetical protein
VYKYTFKPPDHTAVTVDEIEAHLAGRLLSASEAVYRLLALPLHKEWPSVVRLDIHLPHQQRMIFDPTADETELLDQLTTTTSTLMGWFMLNREDAFARSLLYQDIPSYYHWQNSHWIKRVYTKVHFCSLLCAALIHVLYRHSLWVVCTAFHTTMQNCLPCACC